MKNVWILVISCSLQSCFFKSLDPVKTEIFETRKFNQHWVLAIADEDPANINLPNIPQYEPLVVNDQWQGNSTYSKTFEVVNPNQGRTFLHFEGVMHDATVFINDTEAKRHQGGYLPFSVDLTDHLKNGENNLRVEVSNLDDPAIPPGKPLNGLDFNYYGGIYRDVWLIRKGDIYITDPFIENCTEAGWLIHFDEVSSDKATGILSVQLKSEVNQTAEIETKVNISLGGDSHSFSRKSSLGQSESEVIKIPIEIPSPQLWSTTSPTLYDLSVEITSDDLVYDRITDKIGIRNIELNDKGFFLNGEKQFIRGTNRHQEYPYVGYAISNNANFRDALKIKNAGFDLIRMSHYPQDESFLDACDELGILVMNAIPGWQHYQEGTFVENAYQDIRDMIRRDRNHPSVIFWEVSLNESAMTDEFMIQANQILKEELPFEDTYSAGWIDHPAYDLFIPARQHAKPPHYWNNHKDGNRNLFIAEYGDWEYYAHNAGFNQSAFEDLSDEQRNSRQLRAHGEKRLLQQALNFQEAANSNRKGAGTIGHANWLMFDYNRGYSDDLEASGISDIFRLPKYAYHFYKSQRPPEEVINHPLVDQGPMVKIATHWTEASPTDIRVFSNCDKIALYLDDSLIEVKTPTINEFSEELAHPPFIFAIDHFQPGKLRAVGFLNGEPVAMDSVSTPSAPNAIRLSVDSLGSITEENEDLFFAYAEIIDSGGNLVNNASNPVLFMLEGAGQLIGENPVKAEAGIASILFKGTLEEAGRITTAPLSISTQQ